MKADKHRDGSHGQIATRPNESSSANRPAFKELSSHMVTLKKGGSDSRTREPENGRGKKDFNRKWAQAQDFVPGKKFHGSGKKGRDFTFLLFCFKFKGSIVVLVVGLGGSDAHGCLQHRMIRVLCSVCSSRPSLKYREKYPRKEKASIRILTPYHPPSANRSIKIRVGTPCVQHS